MDGPCRQATYSEQLQVGYRWYHAHSVTPLFCFGHGLSYTSFHYDNLLIDSSSKTVSFQLTNTGSITGAEVPQLYLTYPSTETLEPPIQLKGFTKVQLESNETTNIQFNLTARSLSIWDLDVHDWLEVQGSFSVAIGASSKDIRLSGSLEN